MAQQRQKREPEQDQAQQATSGEGNEGAPPQPARPKRGFAAMDQQRQREIASEGGKAAHQKGTAHEFSPEEARVAGRKGGEAVSKDRQHMAEIGREGGRAGGGHRNRAG